MADDKRISPPEAINRGQQTPNKWLGSLRDVLSAANRAEHAENVDAQPPLPAGRAGRLPALEPLPPPLAAAAREPRGEERTQLLRPAASPGDRPQTARVRPGPSHNRTTLVRGKTKVSRSAFHQDPVVGWLVVVGGLGLGAFRCIYEGNNTIGRASSQRIPLDFGDDSISAEEQAYIRYDSTDRSFLFVPNLTKTNVVSINDKKPTGAVVLAAMDVIQMGHTQLAFVPFCGEEFDWAELAGLKE